MQIVKFNKEKDLKRVEDYLREEYQQNKNMTSWLPERFHDLIYRLDSQYKDAKKELSSNYIYMWEENEKIHAVILPDGDAIYMSISKGYEYLFEEMLKYAEENCKPLFETENDGTIDFLVIANDSLKYRKEILEKNNYVRQKEEDYDNFVYPKEFNKEIKLPENYKIYCKDEYSNEDNKWSACNLGFHPDLEDPNYHNGMNAYNNRKNSSMYEDSFDCVIVDENSKERNNVCCYSFTYVDKKSKTAFIEPVSTREKYRHKGLGTIMMHKIILKCKELGVEKCYVNSYDWRRKFYNAAGFETEDIIGFYHKKIN